MARYCHPQDRKQRQHFLAKMQGTHKPVLPVHSPAERDLFRQLMTTEHEFNKPNGPNWIEAVKIWNWHADRQTEITYKVYSLPYHSIHISIKISSLQNSCKFTSINGKKICILKKRSPSHLKPEKHSLSAFVTHLSQPLHQLHCMYPYNHIRCHRVFCNFQFPPLFPVFSITRKSTTKMLPFPNWKIDLTSTWYQHPIWQPTSRLQEICQQSKLLLHLQQLNPLLNIVLPSN